MVLALFHGINWVPAHTIIAIISRCLRLNTTQSWHLSSLRLQTPRRRRAGMAMMPCTGARNGTNALF